MKNGKAANARYIGPMTAAVAQELRAELARQKRSAKGLAEENGLNRSTLHKTLNAQRAIDVDDLLTLSDLLNVSASDLFSRAERIAREEVPNVFISEDTSSTSDDDVPGRQQDYDIVANDSINEFPDGNDTDYDHA